MIDGVSVVGRRGNDEDDVDDDIRDALTERELDPLIALLVAFHAAKQHPCVIHGVSPSLYDTKMRPFGSARIARPVTPCDLSHNTAVACDVDDGVVRFCSASSCVRSKTHTSPRR